MWFYNIMIDLKYLMDKILVKILTPIAKIVVRKRDNKEERIKENMTQDKAEYLVAKGIAREVIRKRRKDYRIHSAEFIDTDNIGGKNFTLLMFVFNKEKEKIAYRKLSSNIREIEVQKRIISHLEKMKRIKVLEDIEDIHDWDKTNYRCTYVISYNK